jgi:succinate-semialdehyde dehydrogenase/glutarate-semialdehyde dehydrogenase
MELKSINPANGQLISTYKCHNSSHIEEILKNSRNSFMEWNKTPFEDRSKLLFSCASHLRKNSKEYAYLITEEMGKVICEAEAEIEKCAWVCDYYAEYGESFLKDEPLPVDGKEVFVAYQPLGCVLAIMPWNFPFWQVFRFAAPALMAGNVGLLKHATNVTGCSLAIERVFREAGFPDSVFQSLIIDSGEVESIITDNRVHAVTLTGSEAAGKAVASVAGKNIKKTVLELGGSDAFIVLEDCDLQYAVDNGVKSRMINCGQSCIAAKRFIVVQSVANKFAQLFVDKVQALKNGDPTELGVDYGPLARVDLAEQLQIQLEQSLAQGAKMLVGGSRMEGAYYPATVITNVTKGMPAYDQELFGPVASIIVVKDENEAIHVANDSFFGLGASVWTSNLERGKKIARQIEAGAVFINQMVASDPRIPFGGIKNSGYGRELSCFGIREFVNVKPIVS